jgi:ADP-ribose pyrophosphatase
MTELSITRREELLRTPYFTLVAKHVDGTADPFYSLSLPDYVAVVATTAEGHYVLVRQFRPAVEAVTLELPAGLIDDNTTPEQTAARELREETGFVADHVTRVGCMTTDTGRLSNRLWVCAARGVVRDPAAQPEPGMEVVVATQAELNAALASGRFDHSLHVAALLFAVRMGHAALG